MEEFWRWLNENAAAVTALATVLLAGVTYIYVRLTGRATKSAGDTAAATARAAEAAERQVRLQTMPYLVPTYLRLFENDGGHLEIEVRLRNEGAGAALNVSAAVAYFRGGFEDREQTPFRRLVGSISPGVYYPNEDAQEKSWVLPSAQRDLGSWLRAAGDENYGLVVVCADATDSWLQFVYWKARNRTEVEAIEKPHEAGYDD